ncbi:hypothetical protein ACFQV2_27140 [Actinokineospora soli]|uniref:Uncharacterized protein n=1 Tax=Actinokineospora soli TaxID=1048753 RepID=A0ABW2TUV4_9PSEU
MTEHARGLARRLVAVTRGGSAPGFDAPLDLLGGPDERTRLRAVLRELVHATASMLLKRGTTGTDQTYLLDLHDTAGKPVAVDELAPPVRALVRAVLADLNGHPRTPTPSSTCRYPRTAATRSASSSWPSCGPSAPSSGARPTTPHPRTGWPRPLS